MRPAASNTKILALTLSTITNGLSMLSCESTTQSAAWRASRDACSRPKSARWTSAAAASWQSRRSPNAAVVQGDLITMTHPPNAKAPRLRVLLLWRVVARPGTADLVAVFFHRTLDGCRRLLLHDRRRSGCNRRCSLRQLRQLDEAM